MKTEPASGIPARLLLSFLLLLGSFACTPGEKKEDGSDNGRSEEKSDRAKRDLEGKVSKLVQKKYAAKGEKGSIEKGERVGPAFENFEVHFNKAGMKTRELWFDSTDKVQRKVEIQHDESGEQEKRRVVSKSGDEPQNKTLWKYEEGRVKEKQMKTGAGKLKWKEIYEYDTNGRKVRTIRKNGKGEKIQKVEFERDQKGRVTQELHLTSSGSLQRRTKYMRDDKGRIARKTHYDDRGTETGHSDYAYNGEGDRTQVKKFDENGKLSHWRDYSYNSKGELVEELHRNKKGEVVKKILYNYEYDEKGNWTERITLVDGDPRFVTERDYSYE